MDVKSPPENNIMKKEKRKSFSIFIKYLITSQLLNHSHIVKWILKHPDDVYEIIKLILEFFQ
jgi:hypothetical protein